MAIFTVHLKGDAGEPSSLVEQTRLVREGFSWGALVFGPLWLIWHRLWLALVVWLLAEGVILGLGATLIPNERWTGLLELLVALLLGLEGAQIRRAKLARRGYAQVDVVSAPRLEQADRLFFERHLAGKAEPALPAPTATGRPQDTALVGLFPSMGR